MRSIQIIIGCLFLLAGHNTAFGESDNRHESGLVSPPGSVLFLGNSLTFYNNAIYTHLRKFLVAEDPANRQRIFLKSMTISGGRLQDHKGGLAQMLESRSWDIVVLQGHSREAVDTEMVDGFRSATAQFAEVIRGQGGEPVLFMTWARSDHPGYIENVNQAYSALGEDYGIAVVPVGLAFEMARTESPDINLHNPDHIHPSLEGTYLAAAVFYAALFGKSPVLLDYAAGLEEGVAARLREIAWQTVARNRESGY